MKSLLTWSAGMVAHLENESVDHMKGNAPVPLWVRPESRRPGKDYRSPVIADDLQSRRSNAEDATTGPSGSLRDLLRVPNLSGYELSHLCWLPTPDVPRLPVQNQAALASRSTHIWMPSM